MPSRPTIPLLLGLALGLWGCATDDGFNDDDDAADDDSVLCVEGDRDCDGLSDTDENELGTDPDVPDSDGDGWFDGEEVAESTDPLEYYQHPFECGYPPGPGPVWQGDGWASGATINNVDLLDQCGERIDLHALSGWGLLIFFGAPW
jgi:hypothetical protein